MRRWLIALAALAGLGTVMLRRSFLVGLLGLLPTLSTGCPCCNVPARADEPTKTAALGAETRALTAEEAKTYALDRLHGRPTGQYVTGVENGGPAEKAGLAVGDVLLALDANKFYSRDDLDDFLRVTKPGAKVRALVKRDGTLKEEALTITLSAGTAAGAAGFTWHYAGTAQLDTARAAAKKAGKLVLVGLSGAET